jgi:spermidine synthase
VTEPGLGVNQEVSCLSEPKKQLAGSQWWQIPVNLADGKATLHLNDTTDATVSQLLGRVRSGRYGKPFVLDDGKFRRLHFSLHATQSRMSLRSPDALTLAYTRKMMSFVLFQPRPEHVVIVGLGGGSLTKFCYRQLPDSRVTTVEIDQAVIDLATLFHVPNSDARMRIVHADAARYLATSRQSADVILVDGCDKHGVAPTLSGEGFFGTLRRRLKPGGVLVMNLVGSVRRVNALVRSIASAFDDQVLVLDVSVGDNRIAFAFRDPAWPPNWTAVKQQATSLAKQYGLDFVAFAERLETAFHEGIVLAAPTRNRRNTSHR